MLKRKIVKVAYLKELEDKVDALTRENHDLLKNNTALKIDNEDLKVKVEKLATELNKNKTNAQASMKKWLRGYPDEE